MPRASPVLIGCGCWWERLQKRFEMIGVIFATGLSGIVTVSSTRGFPEQDLQSIFPDVPTWPARCELFSYTGTNQDGTAQWLRWNEFISHLTMVLLKVDRASMHHSLEVRVPLLDREVIDVASRVHWRSCLDLTQNVRKVAPAKVLG